MWILTTNHEGTHTTPPSTGFSVFTSLDPDVPSPAGFSIFVTYGYVRLQHERVVYYTTANKIMQPSSSSPRCPRATTILLIKSTRRREGAQRLRLHSTMCYERPPGLRVLIPRVTTAI
jgi:hypothetical protein